ncbi:hypothetical protein Dimus_036890 [Dionaea muscipula]
MSILLAKLWRRFVSSPVGKQIVQKIHYEWFPHCCAKCGGWGHKEDWCNPKPPSGRSICHRCERTGHMGAECQDFMKAKGKERRAKSSRGQLINGHVNQGSLSPSRQLGQKVDGSKQDDGLTLGKEPEWHCSWATVTKA